MKPVSICAIVATFNKKELLSKCLTALLSQSRPLDEIILIDNASTDGTEEFVKSEFNRVTYVKLPENTGSAGGFGAGLKLACEKGHDWIWVMDNDAVAQPDALEKLADSPALLADGVYAVASAVVDGNGGILRWNRVLFDSRTLKETPVEAARYKDDYFEVDIAGWAGLLVSRRAVEDVGLPLKDLFIYHDDFEYSLRMRRKGSILTIPASKVFHPPGPLNPSTGKPAKWLRPLLGWKQYYVTRNHIYTCRKYARPGLFWDRLPFYAMIALGLAYGVIQTLAFREYKLQSLRIRLRATWDGLRGKIVKNNDFLPE